MYKLTYFKATNVSGFVSGLQKKTFEVDLSSFVNKDIIAILGDNATGKSTFMSFIHPLHTPTNKKKKFILEGKEGSIIREYTSEDGTIICTKCIYTPSGEKHNSKLYFKIVYPDGEEQELNPNGNVSSYYDLVKEYFGINQDFINFASYNNTVKGIVTMTDSERKSNVAPLMPNTSRFELAYSVINEKYKEYRSIMRNISQKIIKLRDESSLKAELKRIERTINEYNESRENLIMKYARYDGRIKELSENKDIDVLMSEYRKTSSEVKSLYSEISSLLYTKEYDYNDAKKHFALISKKKEHLNKDLTTFTERLSKAKKDLYDLESKYNELSVLVNNMDKYDLADLTSLKVKYLSEISEMKYKPDKKFDKMDYMEIINLINNLEKLFEAIDNALVIHGDLISKYYKYNTYGKCNMNRSTVEDRISKINKDMLSVDASLNTVYIRVNTLKQFSSLADILNKRPSGCKIDTCPFIAEALRWTEIEEELKILSNESEGLVAKKSCLTKELDIETLNYNSINSISDIEAYALKSDLMLAMKKYLNIDYDPIRVDISNNVYNFDLYLDSLRDLAAILSEKRRYDEIVESKIPNIDTQIKMIEASNIANSYILDDYNNSQQKISTIRESVKKYSNKINIIMGMIKVISEECSFYEKLIADYEIYNNMISSYNSLTKNSSDLMNRLSTINELIDKQEACKKESEKFDKLISNLMVSREQFKYELNSLLELKAEKNMIEQDFNITHIMKSIIQPGKGLWKEILEIYMYDIKNIANQLLLNTFNGNLYLEDFIIMDDSFIIPYVYKGTLGADISLASDSQQSTISTAMSLAILSKLINKYGILTYDEVDKDLSPANKEVFINILAKQTKYVGINQNFIITHNPEYYDPYDVGYVLFPGYSLKNKKNKDTIEI